MLYYNIASEYFKNISIVLPTYSIEKMYNYTMKTVYNVPIFTYGTIAITTIVLATITVYESTDNSKDESIFSKLPGISSQSNKFGGTKMYKKQLSNSNKTRKIKH